MHWLQHNEPENWAKAHKFLLLSTYLNYRLTGEYKDSDASLVGHIPFNYKTRKWDKPLGVKADLRSKNICCPKLLRPVLLWDI